jgi:hypothetical protein
MNEIDKKQSEIYGSGWGDCHTWYEFKFTPSDNYITRYTTWKCKRCFAVFNHMYNYIPNIFDAMKACKVPNVCTRKYPERLARLDITGVRIEDKTKGT